MPSPRYLCQSGLAKSNKHEIQVFNQEGWQQKLTQQTNNLLGKQHFRCLRSQIHHRYAHRALKVSFFATQGLCPQWFSTFASRTRPLSGLKAYSNGCFFLATLLIKNLDFPAWRQGVAAATRKTNLIYKSHQISYTSKSNLTKSHFAPLCLHSYCTFLGPEGRGITMIAFLFNIYLAFSLIWASPENNKHENPSF